MSKQVDIQLFTKKGFLVKHIIIPAHNPGEGPEVIILGRRFFKWISPNTYSEVKGIFI